MFKKLFVFGLLMFGLCAAVSAQSGRRVRNPNPEPVSTGTVQREEIPLTSNGEKGDPEVGYSESAPNSARRLSVRPVARNEKKDKKDKKDKKTETKTVQTTNASATVSGAEEDDEVLKVETNLVSIPVSVYDRNGIYIPNLKKEDFKIFEDGKEQEVAYFGTSDKPFTVVLLIDVSPSTEYKIEQIQEAAISFVNQLKPQDNVMVIQFDSRVDVLTKPELTNDREKIYKAINNTGFGGGTSLYDAVDFSLRKRLDKIEGRKAIVLFTDGVDTTSNKASYQGNIRDAEEMDAMVYPIRFDTYNDMNGGYGGGGGNGGGYPMPPRRRRGGGGGWGGILSDILTGGSGGISIGNGGGGMGGGSNGDYAEGKRYLEDLARVSGGRNFEARNTYNLEAAFSGIAEELRRQYSIGYYPENVGQPGQRKQVSVRVKQTNAVVRAKNSYIVGNNGTVAQQKPKAAPTVKTTGRLPF